MEPEYTFDFTNKNFQEKVDGKNDYCYENDGVVYISMDAGDELKWDTSILNVTKNGNILNYSVSMNNTDYTGKTISFDKVGFYSVVYSYTDENNYRINESGEIEKYSQSYVKNIYVDVSVVEANWKNAEITVSQDSTENFSQYKIVGTSSDKDAAYKMYFLSNIAVEDYTENGDEEIVSLDKNIESASFVDTEKNNPGHFSYPSIITLNYKDGRVLTVSLSKMEGSAPKTKTCTLSVADGDVYIVTDGGSDSCGANTWKVTGCSFKGNNGATVSKESEVVYQWNSKTENYYSGNGQCVTPDTLITLANGSQVRVDSLTGNEQLLVWNLETGKLDSAPIMFMDSEEESEYEVVHLYFSDGTDVKVIYEHGFWDYDLNKYVYLDCDADKYIGHSFAKQSGDKLTKVQLTDVVLETMVTTAWSPVTADHLCYFVDGMLSMPGGVGGLFNIFDVDAETMTYDMEAMARDIEKYGLFTYEELSSYVELSEDMFYMAGGPFLKVSIGKGNMTMDELITMIKRYSKFFE